MTDSQPKRVLFSGYAPVHFVCFLPVYQELANDPRFEVWLSGGLKRESEDGQLSYDLAGLYDRFPVRRDRVISFERSREEDFDVLVCSHLSDGLFPRSTKRSVQIFHGVSFKNLAVREKALRFDYLCLPGRYHGELYRKQGLVREGGSQCLLTGMPKTDGLVAPFDRGAVMRRYGLDESLPTVLFAPTGEKHNALEIMGRAVIEAVARSGKYNLLIKPHDHPKKAINWFEELAGLEGPRVRLVRDLDVVPYLRVADALMTDASSVAFEYTLVDRPLIFLDTPRLFQQVEKRAPALDLQTYGRTIGVVVQGADDVVAQLDQSLAHPDEQRALRRAAAEHIFHRPGQAARRVAGVVAHAAGLEPALPEGVELLAPEAA
jgi:hypothetical protein